METGGFTVVSLLGPLGGQLAIAFGAGCAAGYAFCVRTLYKVQALHLKDRLADNALLVTEMKEENVDLKLRATVLEDRLYTGTQRQMEQIRESGLRIIERKRDKPNE